MSERHTFTHSFGRGFTCTVEFEPAIHYNREAKQIRPLKKWNPQPSNKDYESFFPEYIEWVHLVNLEFAKIVNGDHLCVFSDRYAKHPFWELWLYQANGEKKRLKKAYGIFKPYAS